MFCSLRQKLFYHLCLIAAAGEAFLFSFYFYARVKKPAAVISDEKQVEIFKVAQLVVGLQLDIGRDS